MCETGSRQTVSNTDRAGKSVCSVLDQPAPVWPGGLNKAMVRLARLTFVFGAGILASLVLLFLFALNARGVQAAPLEPLSSPITVLSPSARRIREQLQLPFRRTQTFSLSPSTRASVQAQGGGADLVLGKLHTPAVVDAGMAVTYTLVVVNTGPSSASSVLVTDTLPLSVTFVSASPVPNSQNGQILSWNLGVLPQDAWEAIQVVVTVNGDASGSVINTAEVSSGVVDPDPTNNVDADTTPLTQRADLSILKRDTPDPVVASQALTFTLTVTNDGPSDAQDVVVTDVLPPGIVVTSVEPVTSSQDGRTVIWEIGRLARGASRAITVVSVVERDVRGIITNTAAVGADTADDDLLNNQYSEPTLVIESADLGIGTLDEPDPVVAGTLLTYTLQITNGGPLDATGVWATDTLPAGVTVSSVQPATSTQDGQTLAWNLGTLANGAQSSIVVVAVVDGSVVGALANSATVSAVTPDPDSSNNQSLESTQVNAVADLVLSKSDESDPVAATQVITYALTVVNLGPSDAVNTSVTDTIPLSVTVSSVQPPTTTQSGRDLVWNRGVLAGGDTDVITIVARVDGAFTGTLTNEAAAFAATADPAPGNNTTSEDTTVTPAVDLQVDKTAAYASPLGAGDRITYTIVVSNAGAADATDALVRDALPANTAFVTGSIVLEPGGAGTAGTTSPVIGSGLAISAGERVTVTYAVTVSALVTAGIEISNSAAVTSAEVSTPVGAGVSAVVRGADLAVSKSSTPATAVAGETRITYTVAVSNRGMGHVVGAVVGDALPVDVEDGQWGCESSSGSACTTSGVGDINDTVTVLSGGWVTYTVTGTVSSGARGVLTNVASVSMPLGVVDENETDNVVTDSLPVSSWADVGVTKGDERDPAVAGETLTYTLVVSNAGPSDAQGVVVTDTLPMSVTYESATPAPSAQVGREVVWDLGTLASGQVQTVSVRVGIGSGMLGVVTNAVTVTTTTQDPVPGNDETVETTVVEAVADVVVVKGDDPDPTVASRALTYTLTVSNVGPSDARDVVVTDTLPVSVTVSSAVPATSTQSGRELIWELGTVGSGESREFTVVVTVSADVSGTITNTVQAGSVTNDSDEDNNQDSEATLVLPSEATDLTLLKSDDPDPVVAGEVLTYTLVVTNGGLLPAEAVVVTDTLPASVTVTGVSLVTTTQDAQTLSWDLGTLAPGAWQTIEVMVLVDPAIAEAIRITNTAGVTAATSDPRPTNNYAVRGTEVIPRADLRVSKRDDPDPVVAGGLLTYTLTVANDGPSNAIEVAVTDTLPLSVTVVSVQPVTSSQDGRTLAWRPGTVSVTGSVVMTVVVRVDPEVRGTISNAAQVSASTDDPVSANNGVSETTTVVARADVVVSMQEEPDPVIAGGTLTYTLTVTNNGPLDADGVWVTDTLPAGVTVSSIQPVTSTQIGQLLAWDLGTVVEGLPQVMTIVVAVDSDVSGTIANNAEVSGSTPDPVPANNQTSQNTQVNAEADLVLIKQDDPDPVTAGQVLTYSLVITNDGPSDASDVVVTDVLPASAEFVDASSECVEAGGTVDCVLGGLVAGASEAITIRVTIPSSFGGTITNTAGVSATTADPAPGNNTTSEDTTVTPAVDLQVDKTAAYASPLGAGDRITYTIVVSNAGAADATDALVRDALPANTAFVTGSIVLEPGGAGTAGTTSPVIGSGLAISAGERVTVTYAVTVSALVTAGIEISNSAAVTSAEVSTPVGAGVSAVVRGADLAVSKSSTPATAVAGETRITYTVAVSNRGMGHVVGAVVGDALPVDVEDGQWGCESSSGSACTTSGVGDINDTVTVLSGGWVTYTVTGTVSSGARGVLTNVASVSMPLGVVDENETDNVVTDSLPVSSWADVGVTKGDERDPAVAGETLTYTLVVSNAGPSDAQGVVVTDTLPMSVTYESATPAPSAQVGREVVWDLGTLASGQVQTVSVRVGIGSGMLGVVTNAVTVTTTTQDPVPGNDETVETTVVEAVADVVVVKGDDPDPTVASRALTYTLTVSNVGPSDARDVVVTDTLPVSVTVSSAVPATSTQSGRELIWELGTVGSGESREFTVVVTVSADVSGTITNTVQAGSVTNDSDADNNQDSEATLALAAVAELVLSKSHSPILVPAGDMVTYTLLVLNNGPLDAEDVVITDTLPVSATLIRTDPVTSAQSGLLLTWDLGILGDDVIEVITVVVRVDSDVSGSIVNRALVSSLTREFDLDDNQDRDTTPVITLSDLAILKSDVPDPVLAGEVLTYTMSVVNDGPSDAQAVVVTDALPAGVVLVSVTPPTDTQNGGILTWRFATVPGGLSETIQVVVAVDSALSGTIENMAEVRGDTNDPAQGNNRVTQATVVDTRADLVVNKLDAPDPVIAGTTLTYTLVFTNRGPSNAQSVALVDTLPAGVAYGGVVSATTLLSGPALAGSQLTWSAPSIVADAAGRIVFTVTVDSGTTGVLSNRAVITSGTIDPNASNNTGVVTTALLYRADLALAKTDDPDPATAGEGLTFTITAVNHGPSDAVGVVVADVLPPGVTFLGSTPSQGVYTDTSGVWNVGTLPAGGDVTLAIAVTANASLTDGAVLNNSAVITGTYVDPISGNNSAAISTTVRRVADLSVAKSDSAVTVTPGRLITYVLTVVNNGPSNATGLVVSETLPANSAFDAGSSTPGWVQGGVPNLYTFVVGDLVSGDRITAILGIVMEAVMPSGVDVITNTAVVIDGGLNGTDPVAANNVAIDVDQMLAFPDLGLIKTGTLTTTTPGTVIVYGLVYSNAGDQEASGVVLTETVPADTMFDAAASSAGWSCPDGALPGTVCAFDLGSLAAGDGDTLTFAALVDDPLVAGVDVVTNTAILADDGDNGPDVDPGDNQGVFTTTIVAAPDLMIVKDDGVSVTYLGDVVTYTLMVRNVGNQGATGVMITDELAAYVRVSNVSDGGAETVPGSGVVVWPVFDLPGATTVTRVLTVIVSDSVPFATDVITNVVAVIDDRLNGPEPTLVDNVFTLTTAIEYVPVLSVTKHGPAAAFVHETVAFTFVVTNDGAIGDGSPLSQLDVSDDYAGTPTRISGDNGNELLEIGEVWVYTATYRIQLTDPVTLVNTVMVLGEDGDGDVISSTGVHSMSIEFNPGFRVIKLGPEAARVGETVVYTLVVGNSAYLPTGIRPLASGDGSPIGGVVLTDSIAAPVVYVGGDDGDALLELGEAWVYTAAYTIQPADPDPLVNIVVATGIDSNGDPIFDSATHDLDVEYTPLMRIHKEGPTTVQVSDTVHYTFTLSYDSAQGDGSSISGVTVTDDTGFGTHYAGGDDGDGLLEPGETWVYTATYVVQPTDPSFRISTYAAEGTDAEGDIIRDAHSHITIVYGVVGPRLFLPFIVERY